jgi:Hemerythrin HHE cation binding domain
MVNAVRDSSMAGKIYHYLAGDHARLDALLERAAAHTEAIEPSAYAAFRAGLLKHIAMEEKILLPAAQRWRGGQPLPIAAKLRLDHGALAALLVPTPTPSIVAALRAILNNHNIIEEGSGGLYEQCEELAGVEADAILDALRNAPEVRRAPHNDGPNVIEGTRRALAKAGYTFEI